MNIKSLLIKFETLLSLNEVPYFRGAVLEGIKADSHLLFHNHIDDDNLRYKYPMVQYKSIQGHACIFCIGEGVEEMDRVLRIFNRPATIGQRRVILNAQQIVPRETEVELRETYQYTLRDWLPLNERNDDEFWRLQHDEERYEFLQRILIGNILSFAKSIGIIFQEQVVCHIESIDHYRLSECKNVWMKSFDITFSCNVLLPDYIGLGKHASFGYGVVLKK